MDRHYALPVPNDVTELPKIKKNKQVPGVEVRLTMWEYNEVGPILHVGPFSEEWSTLQKMRKHIQDSGYKVIPNSHEEIYMSDQRKIFPEICRLSR